MQFLRSLLLTLLILLPSYADAARLAVLEINDLEIEQKILAQISDGLRAGALDAIRGSDAAISVMTRESMLMMLNDMGIDPTCIEGECEVETARNIGADYVISATLLKLEGVWILSAKLHESEGGDLLATEKVEAKGLLELTRATSGVARALLAKGLGLYASSFGTSASPEAGTSGGAFGGLQMDVSGKLAEKRCGEEAEREGATIRREKMASAVAKAQSNATSAWNGMLADLEACTKLDYDDRAPCIDAVENWITVASKMKVTLPAGSESVQTTCGSLEVVYDTLSQDVQVEEVHNAEVILSELNAQTNQVVTQAHHILDQADLIEYAKGHGSNNPEALPLYKQACLTGSAQGCMEYVSLSKILEIEDVFLTSTLLTTKMVSDVKTSCNDDVAIDCWRLAVHEDDALKFEYYEKTCLLGLGMGCSPAGDYYLAGRGVSKDESKAFEYYEKGCALENRTGCFRAGRFYWAGIGVIKDASKAFEYYEKACSLEHGNGCGWVGHLYRKGDGVRKDASKAFEYYDKACSLEQGIGCFWVGQFYEEGDGVRKDESKAFEYYEKACSLDHGQGCTNLGWAYQMRVGVRQNLAKAYEYYETACFLGNGNGCSWLASLYRDGKGVQKDASEAASLYKKACALGYEEACNR
jgi:TPR repeat protein